MSMKASEGGVRGGHELAPLNTLADGGGGSGREHGVRIVLQGSRGSLQRESAPDRAEWSGKLQFFLSIIGYSVGLGNVWRFPYLCQKNGGGAFLIPFLIMLFLEGIPLFLIEMAIGQKMRLGALGVWNTIHPWLGGLGISSIIVTMFVALYYNVIITWVIFYLLNSINIKLPWAECPAANTTGAIECGKASETAYFWYRNALDVSPAIDEPGAPRWWIVLCLLIAWTIVFFIMMKGIQSSGKVVYFTSMFPYIVLTVFFIRGITLDGAGAGIIHMMNPKMEMLLKPKVWLDAATQVFFSFGLAFGSLIAFGSYNPPDNHCVRDVILVSICNALTAIYASVVIFSILGFKAYTMVNRCVPQEVAVLVTNNLSSISLTATKEEFYAVYENINRTVRDYYHLTGCNMTTQLDQAAEGTGLAFIVITEAITALPISPFWSIIFFLMLLSLGLGSQIGFMEGMLCTIFDIDIFKRISKPYLTGVVCGFCFIVGLLFTTGAGEYWVQVFDSLAGTIGLVVIAFLETIAVIYIYGHEKFSNDIYEMTGYRPGLYWQLTWRFIGPFIILTIFVSSIVSMFTSPPEYAAWDAAKGRVVKYPYPDWVLAIAISMIVASVLPIPGVFLLRRFQCLSLDVDIHQGSIRRIETTVSTKEMMADQDSDDSEDGAVMTRGRYEAHGDEDSSSCDDAAPNIKRGRISMNTRKKFELEVLEL